MNADGRFAHFSLCVEENNDDDDDYDDDAGNASQGRHGSAAKMEETTGTHIRNEEWSIEAIDVEQLGLSVKLQGEVYERNAWMLRLIFAEPFDFSSLL